MAASKIEYLYLWQHKIVTADDRIVTRTCFGITGNLDNRQNGYEGHVGHEVEFKDLWVGPFRPIKDLEDHIKLAFADYLVVGHRNFKYEWINEDITYDQIVQWLDWETRDHPSVTKHQR
jgi:hypothetical protein